MAALFVSVVVSPWNGYQYKCKLLQLIFSSCPTDFSQRYGASDGDKEYLIDITDEKTHGIIYETFDTPASLFFAKTPVHSAEHKGSFRIFADLIFRGCRAVPRKPRKFSTAKISKRTVSIMCFTCSHSK